MDSIFSSTRLCNVHEIFVRFQAIFCTEFDDKRKFTSNLLNEFMENMFEILNNKNAEIESKIHALNIIRDLFVHKDMAEPIHSYIEKAVIVAINGFKSSNWNVSIVAFTIYCCEMSNNTKY